MIKCHGMTEETSIARESLRAYYDESISEASPSSKEEINLQFLEAAATANLEEIQRLLLAGADLTSEDEQWRTAFDIAFERGHISLLRLLLAAAQDRADNSSLGALQEILNRAIRCSKKDLFHFMLEHGASPNATSSNPRPQVSEDELLITATEWMRESIVKLLLKRGANINTKNANNETALSVAVNPVKYPTLEVIHILIQAGADIENKDFHGNTPLYSLIRRASFYLGWDPARLAAARVLLKAGANLRVEDRQLLPRELQYEFFPAMIPWT